MSRVTGIELVRALHESGSSTPVIIYVSCFVDLTLPDAYDLGVEAVLSKPCPRKELVMLCAGASNGAIWFLIRTRKFLLLEQGDQIQQDFKTAPEGCPVAVGRGGISLTPPRPFNPGFSVGFSLGFVEERLPVRSGTAV